MVYWSRLAANLTWAGGDNTCQRAHRFLLILKVGVSTQSAELISLGERQWGAIDDRAARSMMALTDERRPPGVNISDSIFWLEKAIRIIDRCLVMG